MNFKQVIGVLLIIGGFALGLYVGFWVMLIGGIVQIIDQVKATDTSTWLVTLGVIRIIFAAFVGWLCGFIMIIPGTFMVGLKGKRSRLK